MLNSKKWSRKREENIEMKSRKPHKMLSTEVPAGHYWMQGDNMWASLDSWTYGPVNVGLVIGWVQYIVWPPPFDPVGAVYNLVFGDSNQHNYKNSSIIN